MKIVTVCEHGNNRSVHAAYLMRYKRGGGFNDVVAIGTKTSSDELKTLLFDWADWIILTDLDLRYFIPEHYADKLKIWDVGPDRWHRPLDEELLGLLREHMIREFGQGIAPE